MRQLRFRLEAVAFRGLLVLARFLPRRVLLAFGAFGGTLGYLLDRRHRRIALENLRLAHDGQIEVREARRIARGCWRHFGRITLDTLCFPRFDRSSVGRLVHYRGLENIHAAYARGKGVLLFSGHFGHWELTALMQGFLGLPLSLVTRPLDNPRLEALLAELRGRSGNRIIHKRNAVKHSLRALRQGGGVAIVLDQDARKSGVFVPFFGRPASTTPTLALLALRSGAAVVPTYSIPRPDGSYEVVYEPEIPVVSTGNLRADALQVTEQCTAIIEGWVRRHPDLWLWMHRRWKTRPLGAEQRRHAAGGPPPGGG